MITVEGMKMPSSCSECGFCAYTDFYVCKANYTGISRITIKQKRLDNCPLVKVEERKVGKWIKYNTTEKFDILGNRVKVSSYKCSECGRTISDISEDGFTNKLEDYPYCHCGAEMRGHEE